MNLTLEEYIRIHEYEIPPQLLELIDDLNGQLDDAIKEKDETDRVLERTQEQVYFATSLVKDIDNWTATLPKTKQKSYAQIRENTSFEI